MVLCCLFWCQSFGDLSPYVCSLYFYFSFGCSVATFWEIAAHSVGHLYLLYFVYLCFYLFPILVLRASVITMPELVEINLVSDDDNSLTDRKANLS